MWDNNNLTNKTYNEKSVQTMYKEKSVSEVLPLMEVLFDVIIFDEVSQIFIEVAVPTVYRGKKVIVARDDKQLRPS